MVILSISVKKLLTDKGINPREEHLEDLEKRWRIIKELRGNLEGINIDDSEISLRNIPGGDHIE